MKKKPSTLKPGKAIHHAPVYSIVDGKVSVRLEDRGVRIMAVADGYAMVRRSRCFPYVCGVDELSQ